MYTVAIVVVNITLHWQLLCNHMSYAMSEPMYLVIIEFTVRASSRLPGSPAKRAYSCSSCFICSIHCLPRRIYGGKHTSRLRRPYCHCILVALATEERIFGGLDSDKQCQVWKPTVRRRTRGLGLVISASWSSEVWFRIAMASHIISRDMGR